MGIMAGAHHPALQPRIPNPPAVSKGLGLRIQISMGALAGAHHPNLRPRTRNPNEHHRRTGPSGPLRPLDRPLKARLKRNHPLQTLPVRDGLFRMGRVRMGARDG